MNNLLFWICENEKKRFISDRMVIKCRFMSTVQNCLISFWRWNFAFHYIFCGSHSTPLPVSVYKRTPVGGVDTNDGLAKAHRVIWDWHLCSYHSLNVIFFIFLFDSVLHSRKAGSPWRRKFQTRKPK